MLNDLRGDNFLNRSHQIPAVHQLGHRVHAPVLHVPLVHQVPPEPDGALLPVPGLQGGGAAEEAGVPPQGRLELHEQGGPRREVRGELCWEPAIFGVTGTEVVTELLQ